MIALALWVSFGLTRARAAPAASWRPCQAPLMTRWAAQVSPTNAHPEYPRPQLVREDWLNLNGLWDYAVLPTSAGRPTNYDGSILVPFPIESALSGVMKRLSENDTLWYRRTLTVPREWRGRRVRLQFGAVDRECRVYVNGREVGWHRAATTGSASTSPTPCVGNRTRN
jgi:hypothetical protein